MCTVLHNFLSTCYKLTFSTKLRLFGDRHVSYYLSVMRIQNVLGNSIGTPKSFFFVFVFVFPTFTVLMPQEPSSLFKTGNENKKEKASTFQYYNVHVQNLFTTNDITIGLLFLVSAYLCFVATLP